MNRIEIATWLEKHSVKNYTINEDLSVDVDGNVNLSYKSLLAITVSFRNKIDESELFLYNYDSEQIRQYYTSKNLNEKLLI